MPLPNTPQEVAAYQPGPVAKLIAAAVILLPLGYCTYVFNSAMDEAVAKRDLCNDTIYALTMAQQFVKDRLKAPSTAEFPWPDEAKVFKSGDCSYTVTSYVDAQNSFGAQIRSHFLVELIYDKATDRWRATSVNIF